MFNKQASVLNEVISDFKSNYKSQQTLEKREEHAKFSKAVDCLLAAASILDDVGLEAYADQIGSMLEKVSWHVPTSDSAMSGLTPEKMEKNLTEKGWVFNADDGEILQVVEPGEVEGDALPQLNDKDGTIEVEEEPVDTKTTEKTASKESDEDEEDYRTSGFTAGVGSGPRWLENELMGYDAEKHMVLVNRKEWVPLSELSQEQQDQIAALNVMPERADDVNVEELSYDDIVNDGENDEDLWSDQKSQYM